jgi:hypothetical protein
MLFRLLGRCVPEWNRWHETADSFEEARQLPHATESGAFKKLFAQKENQIGDGFSFWLWAGENPDETTVVHAFCGSSTPWQISACVLTPPPEGAIAERVLTVSMLTEVLRAMALAWEPEWAVATSDQHRDLITKDTDPDTFVGWVMYFSRQRGTVPPLPAPVRVEPVEDKGTLVIHTPERFTVSNPEHVALAERVQTLLAGAGLLGPLRPQEPTA